MPLNREGHVEDVALQPPASGPHRSGAGTRIPSPHLGPMGGGGPVPEGGLQEQRGTAPAPCRVLRPILGPGASGPPTPTGVFLPSGQAYRAWPGRTHVTEGLGPPTAKPSNRSPESPERWRHVPVLKAKGPQMALAFAGGPGLWVVGVAKEGAPSSGPSLAPGWPGRR